MDKKNLEAIYPLSPAQQGMLFYLLVARSRGEGRNDAFLEQFHTHIRSAFDPQLFVEAWKRVFARHSALRTAFVWERREKPLQVALRHVELPWVIEDWRPLGLSVEARDAALDALLVEDLEKGLDFSKAPLTRLRLVQLGDDHYYFLWSFTHLLLDGWSISQVIAEAFSIYGALAKGEEHQLEPARPFRDFIAWREVQDLGAAEQYWRGMLEGLDGATSLAIDHGAGGHITDQPARLDQVGRVDRQFDGKIWESVQQILRSRSLTTNSFAQGVLGILVGLSSGLEDVVYGNVVSGRPPEVEGIEKMVGMFINALPIRFRLDPEKKLTDFLGELQIQMVEQRQFEYCPLEQIKRWVGLPMEAPLFELLVAFENYPSGGGGSDLVLEDANLREVSNYPLVVYFTSDNTKLKISAVFDGHRYEEHDVAEWLDRFVELLGRLATQPEIKLGEIRLLSEEREKEVHELLAGASSAWPVGETFPALFAAAAAKEPEKIALEQVGSREKLSYGELDRASTRLAHQLRQKGVGPETLVAISLERSSAAIVALLAVQKAGGATLPIDPQYPADRIEHILTDSGARFLLTRAGFAERFPAGLEIFTLDGKAAEIAAGESEQAFDSGLRPEHLAYVIYTSGSTGKPKGVAVEQRNLVHYACDAATVYAVQAEDRLLQFATLSFDTSAEEIYPALLRGATLILRDEEMIASPETFMATLEREKISVLNLPTAYWHELCAGLGEGAEVAMPTALRLAIIGGEAALAERLERWQASVAASGRNIVLWNTYGPTETTIVATRFDLSAWRPAEHNGEIPIGKTIANLRAYVLDSNLRPLPPGLPGELCIGGAGVARGYLGQPELTDDRFRADTFTEVAGQRFYRTGDRVVARADGNLLFRGRVDQQVKIRGFRVEPGEIESALLALGGMREVSVVARPDGHGALRLVAYLVPSDGAAPPATSGLRKTLAQSLPEYMVPSAFMVLASLPKTPSGKIDRRALPEPEDDGVYGRYVPPRTPMEELVAEVWQELLGRDRIGIHEDFFQLGGHSLLVGRVTTRMRQMLQVDIPITTIFEFPTIDQLASRLEDIEAGRAGGGSASLPPIVPVPRDGRRLPLSYPQERVWFIQQMEPTSIAYNFQTTLWFQGPLEVQVLEAALSEIVRRHEIFWTRFPEADGKPHMVIETPWKVELPITDLRHLPEDEREAAGEVLVREETAKPFDVTQIPLVRWRLVQLDDDVFMLIQVEHHFVHDGWSFGVLLRELKALYEAYAAGQPSPLPELEVQYADFATWQRKYISGDVVGGLVDYWKKNLQGMPMVLDLPTDHPRPNRPSTRGDAKFFMLPEDLYMGLREFSRAQGVTLYMSMMAAFYALLYRYTGQGDLGVGAALANRRHKLQEPLIGMTVNTIVMRCTFDGGTPFAEVLKRTRATALGAYSHQDMPFEQLVAALHPERHISRNPIVQVLFGFHDSSTPTLDFGGMKVGYLVRTNKSAKTDLNVIVAPKGEQLVGVKNEAMGGEERPLHAAVIWEFNRELFEPETIERMVRHYLTLCTDAIRNPQKTIAELSLLDDEERARIEALAVRPAGCPQGQSIPHILAQVTRERPDEEAVVYGERVLTYRALDTRAAQLANALRARGIGPGAVVGLAVDPGPDLVIGLAGILKAGAAYMPLDPTYPAERLAFMFEDSSMALLVAHSHLAEMLPAGVPRLLLDEADGELARASSEHVLPAIDDSFPACLFYTSGSTGKPKGVLVPQAGILRLVIGNGFYQVQPGERMGHSASPAFDAASLEIWAPLLNGGCVIGLDKETLLSPTAFAQAFDHHRIDSMHLVTVLFHQVVEQSPELLPRLRGLIFGGERCEPNLVRKAWQAGARNLVNAYGPTENSTLSTTFAVKAAPEGPVPIGRPIAGSEARVLDRDGQLCPLGVHGELCVGGQGLAYGYVGRPALTAERFVPNPYSQEPGARLYRTGDLVRLNPEGDLEFLGRLDFQIKLRGIRIELGEIEIALARHPSVAASAVLLREDRPGDPRLVAYAVPVQGEELSPEALQDHLRQLLPSFMMPSAFVILAQMPFTANDKIDRRALPAPESGVGGSGAKVAPESETEMALAAIWGELMGLDELGVTDDFFALGGHSLLATQMISRMLARFSVKLGLAQIFEHPTVRDLARLIDDKKAAPGAEAAAQANEAIVAQPTEQGILAQAADLDDAALDALLSTMQTED